MRVLQAAWGAVVPRRIVTQSLQVAWAGAAVPLLIIFNDEPVVDVHEKLKPLLSKGFCFVR
jgi:hypothetical protein